MIFLAPRSVFEPTQCDMYLIPPVSSQREILPIKSLSGDTFADDSIYDKEILTCISTLLVQLPTV